ncbi:MAG: PKD domain-containing protein [Bacteroidetes bacterium]|nr:PKD domain-containing protein [Bacteroidota bacterium]
MKSIQLLLMLIIANANSSFSQQLKVLFIGNSYTYVNDLPNLLYNIALSKGDTITFDSYTPGGYTFEQHSTDPAAIAKIYSQQWDIVILQEQSQRPSFPPTQVAVEVYPYAAMLDSMIHDNNPCSETVFYMTWGRKNGDASNCAGWPPVCTYEGMQARLRESYLEMGMLNNATVAPVGAAFSNAINLNPVFDLYNPDESHPSIYGSYLAACVFYATIFHKSPIGSTFSSTIGIQDAAFLQNSAQVVVNDSISTWYQYGNIPYAAFSYATNGTTVQFSNNSINGTSYSWNFGDGATSNALNPGHTYSQAGSYIVTLSINSTCSSDFYTDTIQIGTTSISDAVNDCNLFYDFQINAVKFNCNLFVNSLTLYDVQGRMVKKVEINNTLSVVPFDISELSQGIYLLKAEGAWGLKTTKLIVSQ